MERSPGDMLQHQVVVFKSFVCTGRFTKCRGRYMVKEGTLYGNENGQGPDDECLAYKNIGI